MGTSGIDDTLVIIGTVDGVKGPGDGGMDRVLAVPGVGGGGASVFDGSVVLMAMVKVEPFPGTPLALMSPPCSWASCLEITSPARKVSKNHCMRENFHHSPSPVPPCCRVLLPSI
jgi:hypothetical protein